MREFHNNVSELLKLVLLAKTGNSAHAISVFKGNLDNGSKYIRLI